ncbi:Lrp/AsnC family transcriptional regulator [Dongia deserti]|uniref:Lrp/AsnC family transcriptional regulator n=1 Tax=Dongia deserti TaxID=2268030 RepID=UPI000E64EB2C|nr:Lrp/AsnC family transcriptional regulator [Dongia deserti]
MAARKSHKIDRIDLKILTALQEQGRMSNLELAAKAGLSASPCHARHRALERSKVIQGYRADVDLSKLIDYVEILSFVTLHKHGRTQQGAFERLIERTPQAIACYQISGNFDYIVHFVCRSVGDYVELHHSLIEEEPNIASVTTNVIMAETKKFSGYPLKELIEPVEQAKE